MAGRFIKDTVHYFSRKLDADGSIRRTRVSKGSGEISTSLWNEILKKQLQVVKAYFNGKLECR
jgi:hypothetical protein